MLGIIATICGMFLACLIGWCAAYSNGVVDGYGYSREPNNPGYDAAGKWLRLRMSHRWPELKEQKGESNDE